MKQDYQKELDSYLASLGDRRPELLLHACCAPCSSYVLEYLSSRFHITLFFYNPNIDSEEEYRKRAEELQRLVRDMNLSDRVRVIICDYDHESFLQMAEGLEKEPEGGKRCQKCFELRLRKTFGYFTEHPCFDHFATTLTISPLKNAALINSIGDEISGTSGTYLATDFKKKNGYLRSIELSRQYCLYRQNYCGCGFSKKEGLNYE